MRNNLMGIYLQIYIRDSGEKKQMRKFLKMRNLMGI